MRTNRDADHLAGSAFVLALRDSAVLASDELPSPSPPSWKTGQRVPSGRANRQFESNRGSTLPLIQALRHDQGAA
jgi:hypothetical protein